MRVVEAPTMVRSPTGYVLFYSGGYFGWNADDRLSPYAMGYASCAGPLGPCKDSPDNPILHSYNDRSGGLPERARPPERLPGRRPQLHHLPRLGGDQRLPQARGQALSVRRAAWAGKTASPRSPRACG